MGHMYVKKVRKKGAKDGKNTYDYLHLVQTTRTAKGPRQQLLLNLGTLPIKKDEWRVFAKEVERRVTGQEVIVKPRLNQRLKQCIEKTVHRLAEKQGQEIKVPDITKEKGRCIQKVDTHSIKTKSHQSIGVEHICHEAYKQLDIDQFLKDKNVSERNRSLIESLVVGRLLEPGSERNTKHYLDTNSSLHELIGQEEQLPLSAYYRANTIIFSHKESLETHLSQKEKELFDFKGQVILYDLTNTYIEGSGKRNEKAKYGRSKDKRYDCLLMTLGLILTSEGFVKKSRLFSGNQSEVLTLQEMVVDLEIQKDQLIVMDAGIASKENLDWLSQSGYHYLVCSRAKHDPGGIEGYKTVKVYPDETQVQVALHKEDNELLAYCKSDRKAHTDQAIRTRTEQLFTDGLQAIKDGLNKQNTTKKHDKIVERIGRLKERYSSVAKRYRITLNKDSKNISCTGHISWHRIEKVQTKNDGIYVLRTNKLDYTAETLWQTYRMLNRVEDSFRYMKSHLGVRPIFHQLTERAETHLFISVLAYRLLNNISYQLRKKGDNRNWMSIKQALRSHMRYTICYDMIQDNQSLPTFIRQCSEPTDDQRHIYKALNISSTPLPAKKLQKF